MTQLTAVGLMARSPTALVVHAGLPVTTVAEFVAHAKSNPTTTFYGYAGIGTTQHQHMEMLSKLTGTRLKGVNYKSSADAQTDLVAGCLQAMIVTVASTLGQIKSGQLRLAAYTDGNFSADSPKAPTMAEAGVKGMEKAQSWWGIFAPPKLPPAILTAMNAAINEAEMEPSFVALLSRSSATPSPVTPEEFARVLKAEVEDVTAFFKAQEP